MSAPTTSTGVFRARHQGDFLGRSEAEPRSPHFKRDRDYLRSDLGSRSSSRQDLWDDPTNWDQIDPNQPHPGCGSGPEIYWICRQDSGSRHLAALASHARGRRFETRRAHDGAPANRLLSPTSNRAKTAGFRGMILRNPTSSPGSGQTRTCRSWLMALKRCFAPVGSAVRCAVSRSASTRPS